MHEQTFIPFLSRFIVLILACMSALINRQRPFFIFLTQQCKIAWDFGCLCAVEEVAKAGNLFNFEGRFVDFFF